jgi:hypothetical protein
MILRTAVGQGEGVRREGPIWFLSLARTFTQPSAWVEGNSFDLACKEVAQKWSFGAVASRIDERPTGGCTVLRSHPLRAKNARGAETDWGARSDDGHFAQGSQQPVTTRGPEIAAAIYGAHERGSDG